MWQPKFIGTVVGWLVPVLIIAFLFMDPLTAAMTSAGFCGHVGGTALVCEWPIAWIAGSASLPEIFVKALIGPFTYRIEADEHGYAIAFMMLFSPGAFALAAVSANYWVWQLRRLLRPSENHS